MPELRAHLTGAKLAVIEELIRAIRRSPAEIDRWMHAVEAGWPIIQDRSFQSREADT